MLSKIKPFVAECGRSLWSGIDLFMAGACIGAGLTLGAIMVFAIIGIFIA